MGLGLHGGGTGTVKFLWRAGAKITVTDLRTRRELAPSLKELSRFRSIRYTLGRHKKADILSSDLIVKNPGVPPNSPYLMLAKIHKIPVTSDLGIFFKLCPGKIIGVTGTRGKSTTAFLIYKFLSYAPGARKNLTRSGGVRTFLGGNIRKSVLEILPGIGKNDWAVLELSSFQLEDLSQERISPHIAVLTNLYRDHLDRHKTMQNYIRAKSNIFKFQLPSDYLFANPDDARVRRMVKSAPSRLILARLPREFQELIDKNLGSHYRSAVGLAVAVARHFKVSKSCILNTLGDFHGLEGRQEYLGAIRGIHFVNDTTATIPDAAIAAIKRFRKKAGKNRLILIAGGQDKKLDFKEMAQTVYQYVDISIFLPGTATHKLKRELRIMNYELRNLYSVRNIKEAVKTAYRLARKGDWILLSPGAASFGLFLNEFDRGEQFVNTVHKLK